jgi:hypothetical protein
MGETTSVIKTNRKREPTCNLYIFQLDVSSKQKFSTLPAAALWIPTALTETSRVLANSRFCTYLSVCPSVCLTAACLSIYLSASLSVYLSIYIYICVCVCLYVSLHPYFFLSFSLSALFVSVFRLLFVFYSPSIYKFKNISFNATFTGNPPPPFG